MKDEISNIKNRYNRRKQDNNIARKNNSFYFNYYLQSERELKYLIILNNFFNNPEKLKFIEIGAGSGKNLYFFLKYGILPENIYANELLKERVNTLKRLFTGINILPGDASKLKFKGKFHIVFQSTVFTSILDMEFKKKLAEKMWEMKTRDGIILWYDFIYDNPFNKDVKGINKKEIYNLFSMASNFKFYRTTLAPPIGRRIKKLYNLVNLLFPVLRTHLIAVIR